MQHFLKVSERNSKSHPLQNTNFWLCIFTHSFYQRLLEFLSDLWSQIRASSHWHLATYVGTCYKSNRITLLSRLDLVQLSSLKKKQERRTRKDFRNLRKTGNIEETVIRVRLPVVILFQNQKIAAVFSLLIIAIVTDV